MPQRLKFFALFAVLVLLVLSSLGWAAEYSKGDKDDNKDVTITTFGELRWRYEYWDNRDFDGTNYDVTNYHLGRARIGVKAEVGENIWGVFQIQDSRFWGDEAGIAVYPYYRTYDGSASNIDFHQAFIKIESLWGSKFGLKIGRQELSYGDERLVGADDWNNIGQSFDGLKTTFRSDYFDFDVFYTQLSSTYPTVVYSNPAFPTTFTGANMNFSGFYATAKPIENLTWDGYVFLLYDGDVPPGVDKPWLWTLGTRAAGTFAENFDYTGEFAFQFGTSPFTTPDDVSAFAMALTAGYTFPVNVKPRIGATFGLASGDDDPTDTDDNTFYPLFPSAHAKWGAMDFQTWSNMMNLGIKGSLMPTEDMTVKAGFNFFWLNKEQGDVNFPGGDWYMPYGLVMPTSGTSKTLGNEIDLGFHYMYNDAVGFSAGYSHFFPGAALEDPPLGLEDASDWFYISTKLGF